MSARDYDNRYRRLLFRRTDGSPAAMAREDAAISARADGWVKPTPAQAKSGEYFKPPMVWNGLDIAIENPAGTVREGVDETGKAWRTEFRYDYGEILGTRGMDGDPVDVFIGPNAAAPEVYIVRQMKRKRWDEPDEDKCFLGFNSMADAKAAYLRHYDDPRFYGSIIAMPVDEFIDKVKRADGQMLKSFRPVLFLRARRP